MAGYDAGCIGNHDIEVGKGAMGRFQESCGYPMLAANIMYRDRCPVFLPYTVIERMGLRIAVIGFSTPATKHLLPDEVCGDYEFEDITESAKRWTEHVRYVAHPDIMVAIVHSGWEGGIPGTSLVNNETKALAMASDFDIIFYGHDHFSRIERVKKQNGKETLCINPGAYGYDVAEAKVCISGSEIQKTDARLHDVRHFRNDCSDNFRERFDEGFKLVEEYASTVVCKLETTLDISQAFYGPSAYMTLIHEMQLDATGADISICATYSTDSVIPAGDCTIADIYKIYWFEDRLYTIRMKGHEIKGLLERSYALWTNTIQHPDDQLLKIYTDPETGRTYFKNLYYNFDSGSFDGDLKSHGDWVRACLAF